MTKPAIFVVGAGPVATLMARSLREAGIGVEGLWARRAEAAESAAALASVPCFTKLPGSLRQADGILLAVRDAAITEVAQMLVRGQHVGSSTVLLHCSGARSAQACFAGLDASIAGGGLLHPLRAIAASESSDLRGCFFGVQGDHAGLAMATTLCEALGGRPLPLGEDSMGSYHGAAAVASNYLVALFDMATQLLAKAGVDPALGREALLALSESALGNIRECGLPQALTGPIRRGDQQTVVTHMQAIAHNLPEALDLYRAAARWSLPMAVEIGEADPSQLSEIKTLLGDL